MDQVVGGELHDVLLGALLAVRQVHDTAMGQVLRDARRGGGRRGAPRGHGVVADQVAVEPVADVGDGRADEERRRPQILADHVVDQVAHRPVPAGRGQLPRVDGDGLEPRDPDVDGALVEIESVQGSVPSAGEPESAGSGDPAGHGAIVHRRAA